MKTIFGCMVIAIALLLSGCSKEEDNAANNNQTGTCDGFAAPGVSNNGPITIGSTLELNAASSEPDVVYEWTGTNSFTSTSPNPVINNAQFVMNGKYYARVSNGTCTSSYVATTVTINPNCTVNNNTAVVGATTWNFYSSVLCGPLPTNHGVNASSSNGNLYIYLNTPNQPAGFIVRTVAVLPGIDTNLVSMRINEQPSGIDYIAQGGIIYIGNNGSTIYYTFCGVSFKSAGGITKQVSAKVICN